MSDTPDKIVDLLTVLAAAVKPKVRHRAGLMRDDGAVSALCFKTPHAINLKRATWTNRDEAVTCQKCLAVIARKVSP